MTVQAGTERVATAPRELLGRDRDLAELFALVDAIEERGGTLVVRGEAGIGKSSLLAAARERALDRGVTVVSTAGALSEAQITFAGLHQLLLPLIGGLDLLPHPQRQALETAFGIAEGDARRAQRRDRQREHALERSGTDRDGGGGKTPPRENHGQQTPKRVADDDWLPIQAADDRFLVVGDLADTLAREHLRVLFGLGDRLGIVGPARGQRHVANLLEQCHPAVPARGQ